MSTSFAGCIGFWGFGECTGLETVYYYGTQEQWDELIAASTYPGSNNDIDDLIAATLVLLDGSSEDPEDTTETTATTFEEIFAAFTTQIATILESLGLFQSDEISTAVEMVQEILVKMFETVTQWIFG